jgi:hypothetical protein
MPVPTLSVWGTLVLALSLIGAARLQRLVGRHLPRRGPSRT